MKNVLLLASVASMIQQFNMRNIELLLKMGYKVEVACNFEQGNTCAREQIENLKKELENKNVVCHQIDFARNVSDRILEHINSYTDCSNITHMHLYTAIVRSEECWAE